MEENGVWRTVGGRRIFIKEGQDLASAMKESGKFKDKTDEQIKKVEKLENKKDELENKINNLNYEEVKEYTNKDVEKLNDLYGENIKNLERLQKTALTRYVSGDYRRINEDLRKGWGGIIQKRIESTMSDLKENTKLFRKTGGGELKEFIKFEYPSEITDEMLKKNVIGKEFVKKDFTSTSIIENESGYNYGGGNPVSYEIIAPKGTKGVYLKGFDASSDKNREYEYLLNKDLKFKITDAYTYMEKADWGTEYQKIKIKMEVIK